MIKNILNNMIFLNFVLFRNGDVIFILLHH
jgi:hypothetical protein